MVEIGVIKMMNAINYTANKNGAKFYRIRQGTDDADLALAVPAMLALAFKNAGCEIDFELVGGVEAMILRSLLFGSKEQSRDKFVIYFSPKRIFKLFENTRNKFHINSFLALLY